MKVKHSIIILNDHGTIENVNHTNFVNSRVIRFSSLPDNIRNYFEMMEPMGQIISGNKISSDEQKGLLK